MDESSANNTSLEGVFGAFHTLVFILALMLLLYLTGSLGPLLGSLNTLIGFALFAALLATTRWTTGQALARYITRQDIEATLFKESLDFTRVLSLGMLWGGINGALFSVALLIAIVFFLAPGAILIALFLLPVAFVVGAVIGLIIACIDALFLTLIQKIAKILKMAIRNARWSLGLRADMLQLGTGI